MEKKLHSRCIDRMLLTDRTIRESDKYEEMTSVANLHQNSQISKVITQKENG